MYTRCADREIWMAYFVYSVLVHIFTFQRSVFFFIFLVFPLCVSIELYLNDVVENACLDFQSLVKERLRTCKLSEIKASQILEKLSNDAD